MPRKKPTANGVSGHDAALVRHLSKVPGVDAIYVWGETPGYCRVYSVVEDLDLGIYAKLARKERLLEKEFPEIDFDVRLWARQGRDPARIHPRGSRLLYVRPAD